MARPSRPTSENEPTTLSSELPVCGVILPISATSTHSEEHWRDVQLLLHRGISAAGFIPRNVWENTSTDRVSERIIGNIFSVSIAVADISDLNPNVMFELGLRLSSKKPTIVVVNSGGDIPFDIRDFHAEFYPPDMNMLGMENFFKNLSRALKTKYQAFQSENYTPFLNNVIVDVTSPQTREVGATDLILTRVDGIMDRLARVEDFVRPTRVNASNQRRSAARGTMEFSVPEENYESAVGELNGLFEVDNVSRMSERSGEIVGAFVYSGASSHAVMHDTAREILMKYGGDLEVPF